MVTIATENPWNSRDRWTVTDIQEADYGCEECGPEGARALVFVEGPGGEKRQCEVSERELARQKIDVGTVVRFRSDGRMFAV